MNLRAPPRQSYKALLWDYDYLLEKSDDECCYSLSEREVQMLLAQVDYISWKTRYKPTETEIDPSTILRWQGNLARKLMSGCCPDEGKIYRFTEDGTLESSIDGGETWTPAPEDDPRLTAPLFTPLPGEDGAAKRCVAANNAAGQIKAQADQIADNVSAWAGIGSLVTAIIGLLVFLSIVGSGGVLTALVVGLAGALLATGREAFIAAMTTDVYETLICALYCNMQTDGSFTAANVEGVKARIADELTGVAASYLLGVVNALGAVGLTNAGRTTSSAFDFDCSVCECSPECISSDWIIIGSLVSQTENQIVIQAELTTHNALNAYWIQYGSITVGAYCCAITVWSATPGEDSSGHWDCDGSGHGGQPGIEPFNMLEAYREGGTWQLTLTFAV